VPGVGDEVDLGIAAALEDQALELLIEPLHFRALLTRQPIDEQAIRQLVDLLLAGLTS
jgi:hypothetical protein